MPNRARQRGDYFERRTLAALEADGWVVKRSPGSKGASDLWALKAGSPAMFISCKLHGAIRRTEILALTEEAAQGGAIPVLAHQEKIGWVTLDHLTRHGREPFGKLHMPPRRRPVG